MNLPFSRLAFAVGKPIYVPKDADSETAEEYRLMTENSINEMTKKAYELCGGNYIKTVPAGALSVTENVPTAFALKAYQFLTHVAQPFVPYILSYRAKKGKEDLSRQHERFGEPQIPRPKGHLLWFHAASVGETNAILPLIHELKSNNFQLNFLLTTGTITSARIAESRLPEGSIHQYIPFDSPNYVRNFLKHWQPNLALFVESEIWPNLIRQTRAADIKLVLLNGRLSKKSF